MTIAVDLGCKATKQTNFGNYGISSVLALFAPKGGRVLRYLHTYVGSVIFLVQNLEFLGVFRKMNIFGGMKILWIFFWGHHKIGLYLVRGHFWLILKVLEILKHFLSNCSLHCTLSSLLSLPMTFSPSCTISCVWRHASNNATLASVIKQ